VIARRSVTAYQVRRARRASHKGDPSMANPINTKGIPNKGKQANRDPTRLAPPSSAMLTAIATQNTANAVHGMPNNTTGIADRAYRPGRGWPTHSRRSPLWTSARSCASRSIGRNV